MPETRYNFQNIAKVELDRFTLDHCYCVQLNSVWTRGPSSSVQLTIKLLIRRLAILSDGGVIDRNRKGILIWAQRGPGFPPYTNDVVLQFINLNELDIELRRRLYSCENNKMKISLVEVGIYKSIRPLLQRGAGTYDLVIIRTNTHGF